LIFLSNFNLPFQTEKQTSKDEGFSALSFASLSGVFIMLLIAAGVSIIALVVEWIVAAFLDVDRTDPTCPSSVKRAMNLRLARLERDVRKHWFNSKKGRWCWNKFR